MPSLPWIERRLGTAAAAIGFVLGLTVGPDVQSLFDKNGWALTEIYGAVFNLSAILCGALAAVYALLVASTTPLLDRIRRSGAFNRYMAFVRNAIAVSFATAGLSIPLLLIKPRFIAVTDPGTILAAFWFAASLAMVVAAIRAAMPAKGLFEARPPARVRGG